MLEIGGSGVISEISEIVGVMSYNVGDCGGSE